MPLPASLPKRNGRGYESCARYDLDLPLHLFDSQLSQQKVGEAACVEGQGRPSQVECCTLQTNVTLPDGIGVYTCITRSQAVPWLRKIGDVRAQAFRPERFRWQTGKRAVRVKGVCSRAARGRGWAAPEERKHLAVDVRACRFNRLTRSRRLGRTCRDSPYTKYTHVHLKFNNPRVIRLFPPLLSRPRCAA